MRPSNSGSPRFIKSSKLLAGTLNFVDYPKLGLIKRIGAIYTLSSPFCYLQIMI